MPSLFIVGVAVQVRPPRRPMETGNTTSRRLLLQAVHRNDVPLVERLLDQTPSLIQQQGGHLPPLILATTDGHTHMVQLLLQRGAPLEATGDGGWTALQWAIEGGHDHIVTMLLQHGASPLPPMPHPSCATAPLLMATQHGRLHVVKALLSHMSREQVNHQGEEGRTAVLLACHMGRADLVRAMLLHGADPSPVLLYGPTAEQGPSGHAQVVALLQVRTLGDHRVN